MSTNTHFVDELLRTQSELESTANKLSDCWLFLDELARNSNIFGYTIEQIRETAVAILTKQQAPGWKT
jgi:hypothetical protein